MTVRDNQGNEYQTRPGFEGPFNFGGLVLYYDPQRTQFWDPRGDRYLSDEEFKALTT